VNNPAIPRTETPGHESRGNTYNSKTEQPVARTPAKFAELFNRHPSWAYRLIYDGRIKILRNSGRMLIPQSETDAFIANVTIYSGRRKKAGGKGREDR